MSDQASHGGTDTSKRRLLKGIAGAAPVVMAVSSKPVLAGFCTVSGFLSGNLSNHRSEQYCGGRSPGFYKSPNGVPADDPTTFFQVFGGVWKDGNGNFWPMPDGLDGDTPTFYQVLNMTGNEDRYEFGAHAVATYLNAYNVSGFALTPTEVVSMVREVIAYGEYRHPSTGRVLDAEELVEFFQQTFDAD